LAAATAGATEIFAAVAANAAAEKAGEIAGDSIDKFWQTENSRIAAMQGFRDALKALTGEGENARKIVFIIDELDRCRPDYALNLLEIIKHFFTVPNVHFVLGVNLKELENSVKARYGANITADKYLQKFVSLTMTLPNSSVRNPSSESAVYYFNARHLEYIKHNSLIEKSRNSLRHLSSKQDVTLRDVQRLLTCFALFPRNFSIENDLYQTLAVGAGFLKVLHPDLYRKLRKNSISFAEVSSGLSLEEPPQKEANLHEYLDWYTWAYFLQGEDWLTGKGFPLSVISLVKAGFGSGSPASAMRDVNQYLAEMLDSYTLQ
jgi:hypothetical protein